jgi:hypothetical protein
VRAALPLRQQHHQQQQQQRPTPAAAVACSSSSSRQPQQWQRRPSVAASAKFSNPFDGMFGASGGKGGDPDAARRAIEVRQCVPPLRLLQ